MTPERWQRVKELFDAALEREPEVRARFLSEATPDDPSLASDQQAGAFLSAPRCLAPFIRNVSAVWVMG